MDQNTVEAARNFATRKLASNLHPQISFHDLEHTKTVVDVSLEIGKAEGVSENDLRLLEVAAWFHDLGYPKQVEGHEKIGANIAKDFLLDHHVDLKEIEKVERIILSTQLSRKPESLLEEIIRDADLAHLGMDNAKDRSLLLRDEKEAILGEKYTVQEWLKINYDFYKNHRYHTKAAREKFSSKKRAYLDLMYKSLNRERPGH